MIRLQNYYTQVYQDCVSGCSPNDFACVGFCSRKFNQDVKGCPCQSGCPLGCPCDDYCSSSSTASTTSSAVQSTSTTTAMTSTTLTVTVCDNPDSNQDNINCQEKVMFIKLLKRQLIYLV